MKQMIDRPILKHPYNRYSPQSFLVAIKENQQLFLAIPSEDSAKSLKQNYLGWPWCKASKLFFKSCKKGLKKKIRWLKPNVLFVENKLTICSREELKSIDCAIIAYLREKVVTSSRVYKDLIKIFASESDEHRVECTVIKTNIVEIHVKISFKRCFWFRRTPKES